MTEVTPIPKPEPRGPKQRKEVKRTQIKPVSDRRREAWPEEKIIKEAVFKRDGYQCRLKNHPDPRVGPCKGRLTYHHLQKASGLGKVTVENGASLCELHNGLMEDEPDLCKELGMVIRG